MKLKDFDFTLPAELIAQKLTKPRDHSRLLIYYQKQKIIKHARFLELDNFLTANDVLVFNNSKVIPARLVGHKTSGGKVEILLVQNLGKGQWQALIRGKMHRGQKITFKRNWYCTLINKEESTGIWQIKFNLTDKKLQNKIRRFGLTPTPPYIRSLTKINDYQTIYAKKEGSIAAPTAGLHFTNRLLRKLKNKGVQIEYITLHVGYGTFKPITSSQIEKHQMLPEWVQINPAVASRLTQAKKEGKRIIAVGTTTVRALETFAQHLPNKTIVLPAGHKSTNIFIYPGYKFKFIDGMITNFHLPKSTPLLMVAALLSQNTTKTEGTKTLLKLYQVAIKNKYHFYSLGDGMLLLP